MNKSDFTFLPERGKYTAIFNGFEIEISENSMSDEVVIFAEAIIKIYPQKLVDLANFCKESETFQICYPEETVDSIIKKLNLPILNMWRTGGGMLTYCNHEIDQDHLIDIEFTGVMDSFDYVSIDG